jgi:hypothetical protein
LEEFLSDDSSVLAVCDLGEELKLLEFAPPMS